MFKKKIFRWQNIFSSKEPFGPVERSFDNLLEPFGQKTHNFALSGLKWDKKRKQFQNRHFWKWSYRHERCSFDNIAKKFLPWNQCVLFIAINCARTKFSGEKTSFPQKVYLDSQNAVLTTLSHFLDKRPIFLRSMSENEKKKKKF